MSFTSNARTEMAREICRDACCARAELAAAALVSGGIAFMGKDRYSLSITAGDAAVARHFFTLIKSFYGVTCEIRAVKSNQLSARTRYAMLVPDTEALRLIRDMGLYDASAPFSIALTPDKRILEYSCCRKAFLKGAFLLCGAVSSPEKQYHAEFAVPNEQFAQNVISIMNYFEIFAKYTCRKTKYVVYLKSGEQIENVLSLLGANNAVMAFASERVMKDVRNRINRQVNWDSANISRAVETAGAQMSDILLIDEQIGLDKLPKRLRDIAQVRLENPDTPMAGLGELTSPQITKSGVNARLRRLKEIADALRSGNDVKL